LYTWELRLDAQNENRTRSGYFWIRDGRAAADVNDSLLMKSQIPNQPRAPLAAFDVSGDWVVSGALGAGTDTPTSELDLESASPSVEMTDTDDGTDGWYMHGWDTSFSLQDKSTANKVVEVTDDAPAGSLFVASTGRVGLGTAVPDAPLHVVSTSPLARVIVAQHQGAETARNMMDLRNNGISQFRLIDTSANGDAWQFSNTESGLNISLQGSGSQELLIQDDGDVYINNGTVLVTSHRASKENFTEVDSREILDQVANLPITTWNYRKESKEIRHLGPVSEDFHQAFGLGEDDQYISPNDLAGVNTAAIQGLYRQNLELKAELEALKKELSELKKQK
jgi:hypothetical protein